MGNEAKVLGANECSEYVFPDADCVSQICMSDDTPRYRLSLTCM